MTKISSLITYTPYKVEIHSPSGNTVIADEPKAMGGGDLGFSPKELLLSSLAACTSATVKMYADRKEWELEEVSLQMELIVDEKTRQSVIDRKISFKGNLDEKQKSRLLSIANACPIHRILTNPIEINTELEGS